MRKTITQLLSDTSGASAVEDGIVLGVCSLLIMKGAPEIGSSVGDLWSVIGNFLGLA